MEKIKYEIKKVKPNIFAVIIEDSYDRAMTFLRIQEFYESPSAKFRGKDFDLLEYAKWYSEEYKSGFSYAHDFVGFNVPLEVALKCYEVSNSASNIYDDTMKKILSEIRKMNAGDKGYVIGSGDLKGSTFNHEICHGLYSTNEKYRKMADEVTEKIPKVDYEIFKANLLEMGYNTKVVNDEMQAYLATDYDDDDFTKGVYMNNCKKYHQMYVDKLQEYV
jgi:hypothetical protein